MIVFYGNPTKMIDVEKFAIADLFFILEELFLSSNYSELEKLIEALARNIPIISLNNIVYYSMEQNKELYYVLEDILKSENVIKILEEKFYNSLSDLQDKN